MSSHNESRANRALKRPQEEKLFRQEQGAKMDELIERSRTQAENALQTVQLVTLIEEKLPQFNRRSKLENKIPVAQAIIRAHPRVLPVHIELPEEKIAFILAIVNLLNERNIK